MGRKPALKKCRQVPEVGGEALEGPIHAGLARAPAPLPAPSEPVAGRNASHGAPVDSVAGPPYIVRRSHPAPLDFKAFEAVHVR